MLLYEGLRNPETVSKSSFGTGRTATMASASEQKLWNRGEGFRKVTTCWLRKKATRTTAAASAGQVFRQNCNGRAVFLNDSTMVSLSPSGGRIDESSSISI